MSAFGGKADIARRHCNVCFWPKADIGCLVTKGIRSTNIPVAWRIKFRPSKVRATPSIWRNKSWLFRRLIDGLSPSFQR